MIPIIADFEDQLVALRDLLTFRGERLVLVESCTAGLVSGILGQIPGISQCLCGSMVVYRNDSKRQWLGIDPTKLDDPAIGPVSPFVTEELAAAVLARTPEATIAGAITGHLGPGAPDDMDGIVFTCVRSRAMTLRAAAIRHRLTCSPPLAPRDWSARQQRQIEAVRLMIGELNRHLVDTSQ
jgi:PncC family amidohydrolase